MPATTTRILLNHFKWDKEKLMERFYDGDQDKLFSEARVINPFKRTQPIIQRVNISQFYLNIQNKLVFLLNSLVLLLICPTLVTGIFT